MMPVILTCMLLLLNHEISICFFKTNIVMKHKELIDAIADRTNRTQEETGNLLQTAIDILTSQILEDNVVNLQGFGSFELKRRKERLSVHPATQVRTVIPPKQTVNFRQSGVLKVKLKEIPSHE